KGALAQIEKAYGEWKGKLDPAPIAVESAQKEGRRAHLDWPAPTLPRLWLTWHAPSANDLKTAAIEELLNGYLFGSPSALHQDLILGRQIVDSMDPVYEDHRDPWLFGILLRVKDAKDLAAVEKRVVEETAALAAGKVDQTRLQAVRSNLKYG